VVDFLLWQHERVAVRLAQEMQVLDVQEKQAAGFVLFETAR
jgi:hypothetical protein